MTLVNTPNRAASQLIVIAMDLGRHIEQYALPPPQKAFALAAIQRFKNQLRPGDAERSALLEQMQDILGDEELDNFRAALERRPMVKAGLVMGQAGGIQGGVIGGVQGGLVTIPAQRGDVKGIVVR
jgi:hypothetical protein